MSDWKLWTLIGPSFLKTRGNQTAQDAPVAVNDAFFFSDGVLQIRQGFDDDTIAAGLGGSTRWIARHIANDGSEEAWGASNDTGTPALARRSAGTWAAATFSDTANVNALHMMQSATQNGKLFLAYDSDVNRLHVWDGTSVRRVGLIVATAPTVASIGGGGLAFTRYYRQRNTVQVSGVTVRRSEPSTSVNITIAASSGVRVTKGAVSGDGATHWEVEYADLAAGPWYRAATVVVGTTTYDDTAATIVTTTLTDTTGLYIPPPSAKYIITDGAVLLMAGAWESSAATGQTTPVQNRVWFTRPLGQTDISDDESITQTVDLKNYIDIGDPGPITGLAGPYYGDIFVFKSNSIYKLVPTGSLTAPYQRVLVHNSIGALDQVAIATGLWKGLPAIYFASSRNIWVLQAQGISQIGDDILVDASVLDFRAPVVSSLRFARLIFSDDNQTLWFVDVTSNDIPKGWLFDTVRGGWVTMTPGTYLAVRGAVINGLLFVVGGATTDRVVIQKNALGTGYLGQDVTTNVTASVTYRKTFAALLGAKVTVGVPTVWWRFPGTPLAFLATITYLKDGSESETATFLFSSSSDARKTLEGLEMADVSTLDVTLSIALDTGSSASSGQVPPIIDAIQIPYRVQESLPK